MLHKSNFCCSVGVFVFNMLFLDRVWVQFSVPDINFSM